MSARKFPTPRIPLAVSQLTKGLSPRCLGRVGSWYLRLFLLILAAAPLSCGGKGTTQQGPSTVLPSSNQDQYTPPDDRKISDQQLRMYVTVRQRELEISREATRRLTSRSAELKSRGEKPGIADGLGALSDVNSVLAADVLAAIQAGFNSAEYQWVKAQVMEVGASGANENFRKATAQTAELSFRYYRTQLAKATTVEEKNMWQQNIESLARQTAAMQQPRDDSEALQHNREVVRRHQAEMDAIRAPTPARPEGKP